MRPRDAKDVEEIVRTALAAGQVLEIAGHGTKREIGHAMAPGAVLDISPLRALISYEPNELIITVEAGTPLVDVQRLINAEKQQFAFEPMDVEPLLGGSQGGPQRGTVGGMIGASLAGPRCFKAGGARDYLLGAQAVSGFGDSFKTGGKVVKNVTGYDLCKLLSGSWGTLAVLTQVTLKVTPKPESERTMILSGLDDISANKAMTAALGLSFDISGGAHLPKSALAGAEGRGSFVSSGEALTLMRLEGTLASTLQRANALAALLAPFGSAEIAEDAPSQALWRTVRDVLLFAAAGSLGARPVWRIVCPPASGGTLGLALVRDTGSEVFYDWGGGLIWAAVPADEHAHAVSVRRLVSAAGGHATLIRASADTRLRVDVFHPQPAGVVALSERVRAGFDPKMIFNRGRLQRSVVA